MIKNCICSHCACVSICKIVETILKFSDDIKRPLGVDIELLKCAGYIDDSDSDDEEKEC